MKITRRAALKSSALAATALALRGPRLFSQASAGVDAHIDILPGEPIATISPEIYGHFIEHFGGVIYDGVWVGPDSKIPNTNGIRQSFIDTMRAVQAPLLRWPGGCFADSYDWRDGLGAPANRPARTAFWGQQDPNRFGLHEFMHTCRAIGCKPYLAADMRSLPARDFYQEIEYCNAPAGPVPSNSAAPAVPNSLAAQRAANGDPDPFNVDLWGVGNESWGCGGNLVPEEYAAMFRRFTAWTPSYSRTPLRFVAVGPNGDDVDWTRRLFQSLNANSERRHLFGLSVHYYTSGSPTEFAAGDALAFSTDDFYDLLTRASIMERVVTDHWAAMAQTAEPGQPHRDEIHQHRDHLGIDPLDRGQHRIVRHRTHRLAEPREAQEGKQCRHRNGCDRQVLELLRPDAQSDEAPVAQDRQVVVAQLVAEAEPHEVLQRDGQRHGGDRCGDQPSRAQWAQHHPVRHHAHRAGRQERHERRRHQRPAQSDIRQIPRERTDRGMRGHREVGKSQHRVDRGQANRGRGQDCPRHHPSEAVILAYATSRNLNAPPAA